MLHDLSGKKILPSSLVSATIDSGVLAETPSRRYNHLKINDSENGKSVLLLASQVLSCHFPDLAPLLNSIKEMRKHPRYSPYEMIMGGLMLFLLRQDSRNEFDNLRRGEQFSKNYYHVFKQHCPSMDALEDFFRKIDPEELEKVKAKLISNLIAKRSLHRYRLLDTQFVIAIDATGVHSDNFRRWDSCIDKTSKNGTVTYMNNVLEAKLVISEGLCLSLCSEWITNPEDEPYDKQDCELSAFKRLVVKLKSYFPRLPACLVFDGLYCNDPVMDICRENGWEWIIVFKDGNLPSVHQELDLLPSSAFQSCTKRSPHERKRADYKFCNNILFRDHSIHWMECTEETILKKGKKTIFHCQYLTSMEQDSKKIHECVFAARKRWCIEESFLDQKEREFNMQHLFSRVSFKAFCNWYQVLQLAYNTYVLIVKSKKMNELKKQHSKQTLKHLWRSMVSVLTCVDIRDIMEEFHRWILKPRQVRINY